MKKNKAFKVDDKVFAKVKGYPAWPAKIVGKNDKKYDVLFYGTKETGSIKAEDIFYYLQYKDQFLKKSTNRKYFTEAVEEIEQEIKTTGTDGNDEDVISDSIALDMTSNDAANSESGKKTKKRKRSISQDKNKESVKKSIKEASSANGDSEIQAESSLENLPSEITSSNQVFETEKAVVENYTDDEVDLQNLSKKENKKNIKKRKSSTTNKTTNEVFKDVSDKKNLVEIEKSFDIVSIEYLDALLNYAAKVKLNETHYKNKSVENRSNKHEIVIVQCQEELLGVMLIQDKKISEFNSEYERAIYDETVAKSTLELLNKIEKDSLKPEDEPGRIFYINGKIEKVQEILQHKIMLRKKENIKRLEIEARLANLDAKIRDVLGLNSADTEKALEYLYTIYNLNIDQLMLKKNMCIVDIIKRLRKYIGNIKEWNMSEEEVEKFQKNAEKIRNLAEDVYQKFKSIFKVPDEMSFWDEFMSQVETFKLFSETLTETQKCSLCAEPDSRQAFIDLSQILIDLPEENDEESEVKKQNKENSSQVANSTKDNEVEISESATA